MRAVFIILTGIFVANAAPIYDPFAFSDAAELYTEEPITDNLLFGYNEPYADGLSTDGLYTDDQSLFGSSDLYLVAGSPGQNVPEDDGWGSWTTPSGRGTDYDRPTNWGDGDYVTVEDRYPEDKEPEQKPVNPDPNTPTSFELHPDQADAIIQFGNDVGNGLIEGGTAVWNGVTWVGGAAKSVLDDWVPVPVGP
jgi:hypothetical protein